MTSVGKLIRRFVGILVLSMFLLFVVNGQAKIGKLL